MFLFSFVFHLSSLVCPPSPLVLNRMQYLLTSIRISEQRSFAERKDQLGFCTTGEQMLRLQKSSGFHPRICPQESNPVASSIRIDSERRVLLVLLNNLLQIQLFPRPEMRALFVGLGHKMLLSNPMPATQYFIAGLARRSVSLGILYTKVEVFVDCGGATKKREISRTSLSINLHF